MVKTHEKNKRKDSARWNESKPRFIFYKDSNQWQLIINDMGESQTFQEIDTTYYSVPPFLDPPV